MENTDIIPGYDLIYVIVNDGQGSRVLKTARKLGITGGTIFRGKGTVKHFLSNLLSLYDECKEIVLLGADLQMASSVMAELNKVFRFEKPHHGIMFSIRLCHIIGSSTYKTKAVGERSAENNMYQMIISIVNRGNATEVIEAAEAVGAKGGTIFNGRGSGIHETSKLFNMDIEPEKEIVLILSKKETTDTIVQSIRERLAIDEPGNGIVFIQDVNQVYGIKE